MKIVEGTKLGRYDIGSLVGEALAEWVRFIAPATPRNRPRCGDSVTYSILKSESKLWLKEGLEAVPWP
jgi:hypothetical protein